MIGYILEKTTTCGAKKQVRTRTHDQTLTYIFIIRIRTGPATKKKKTPPGHMKKKKKKNLKHRWERTYVVQHSFFILHFLLFSRKGILLTV